MAAALDERGPNKSEGTSKSDRLDYRMIDIVETTCHLYLGSLPLPVFFTPFRLAAAYLVAAPRFVASTYPRFQTLNIYKTRSIPQITQTKIANMAVPDRPVPFDAKYDHYDFPTTSPTKQSGRK